MLFETKEQQLRVESIMERLEIRGVEMINPASYGPCRAVKTEGFMSALEKDADDVVTLVAVYLYSLGNNASCYQNFIYTLENGKKVEFKVVRKGTEATFLLSEEI